MAKLISALASGIPHAPSGRAYFYKRGTSTPATVYSGIDARSNEALGTSVALNAYGQYESGGQFGVYAKERVDVIVYKADSATVAARFSDGEHDNSIDVESQSFTGTLESGSTGAGGHTLLRTALDAIKTSFGATDFKVLETGQTTERYLKDALQNVRSSYTPFYNVKAYGALGDGSNDDGAAIKAAITASSGNGIIYFPAGTYRSTIGFTIDDSLIIMGAGAGETSIEIDSTSTTAFSVSSSASTDVVGGICDITIKPKTGSSSGTGVSCLHSGRLFTFRNVVVSEFATGIGTSGKILVYGCSIRGATSVTANCRAIDVAGANGAGSVIAFSKVRVLGAWDNTCRGIGVGSADVKVVCNEIDISAAGTLTRCIETTAASATNAVVVGNSYTGASADVGLYIAHDVAVHEGFNSTATSGLLLFDAAADTYVQRAVRLSREGSVTFATEAGAYAPVCDTKYHFVKFTGGAFAVNAPTGQPTQGAEMCIILFNASGGAVTPTFNAVYKTETVPSVANNGYLSVRFRYQPTTDWLASSLWFQEAQFVTYT